MYCGHLLAVPCGESASNDYLQHMFHGELKKQKNIYLDTLLFLKLIGSHKNNRNTAYTRHFTH